MKTCLENYLGREAFFLIKVLTLMCVCCIMYTLLLDFVNKVDYYLLYLLNSIIIDKIVDRNTTIVL